MKYMMQYNVCTKQSVKNLPQLMQNNPFSLYFKQSSKVNGYSSMGTPLHAWMPRTKHCGMDSPASFC